MASMLNIVLASTTASGRNQHGQPVRTVIETGDLDTSALRLPLSACGRRHPTDGRGQNPAVSGHSVAARQPAHSQTDEASGFCRSPTGAHQTVARNLPGTDPTLNLYCWLPGETEEDFQMLLDFLKEARLDRVGCFKYSPVEGADANALPDQVPEEVKEERWNRFMQLQQQISAERLQEKVGREILVIIDEVDEEGAIGRSMADAPEIDGAVYLNGETNVKPGDILRVKVEHADEYDLWGSRV